MSKINSSLKQLLESKIYLSSSMRSQGSKSHNYIRDVLKNKHENHADFPRLIEGDFLSGSYARGTKLKPLDDIDVMMVLDGAGLYAIEGGVIQDIEVRSSDEDDNPLLDHTGINNLLSSKDVMRLFTEALQESHPNSQISKDGQAVNVWLDSYDIGVDVVPCFHLLPRNGDQDFYYIPEGDASSGWLKTNPKIDERISKVVHAQHDGKLKNVVRLIKYWNIVSNNDRLRSYHIETLVWMILYSEEKPIQNIEVGVKKFFTNAKKYLERQCPDVTKLGDHIDYYLSLEDRTKSLSSVEDAVIGIREAYVENPEDQEKRRQVWQSIFNNELNFHD